LREGWEEKRVIKFNKLLFYSKEECRMGIEILGDIRSASLLVK